MAKDVVAEFIQHLEMFKEAMDLHINRSFTKTGPKGTTALTQNPIPEKEIKSYANKWKLGLQHAKILLESIEDIDPNEEQFEKWFGLIELIETGAKQNGISFKAYAEAYFKGASHYGFGRA